MYFDCFSESIYAELKKNRLSGPEYDIRFLYQSQNVFISDNHATAFEAWRRICDPSSKYNFIHIDTHNDLGGSKEYIEYIDVIKKTHAFKDLYSLTFNSAYGGPIPLLKWDTYLPIAIHMYPQWFSSTLFLTRECSYDPECESKLNGKGQYITTQAVLGNPTDINFIKDIDDIYKYIVESGDLGEPVILNIDLDYFFYESSVKEYVWDELWSKVRIREFVKVLQELNQKGYIKVITIAMSPSCCSSLKDCLEVLTIFCEGLCENASEQIIENIESLFN